VHLNLYETITLHGTSGNNNSAACSKVVKDILFGWHDDEYLTAKEVSDREKKSIASVIKGKLKNFFNYDTPQN